jgi:hypothetical protein
LATLKKFLIYWFGRSAKVKKPILLFKEICKMSSLAVPLDSPLHERLNAQALKLKLKPEELAARAIRNILFFMEMKAMQGELRPLLEAKGVVTEDDLFAAVS